MKLSISNIAWPREDEEWVLKLLEKHSWDAIELAPSRVWEDFRTVPSSKILSYKKKINFYGLEICSLHSLFYGIKDVNLFGDINSKNSFIEYLKKIVDLSHFLGNKVIVLGSPSVRDLGNRHINVALLEASYTLRRAAEYAEANGIMILIEPLSRVESNFVNTHDEGLSLVNMIGNAGFGLHLDAKSIADENDDISSIISECRNKIMHFHINDPGLVSIGTKAKYHNIISDSLKEIGYKRYVSIEMRQNENHRETIKNSVDFVEKVYG